MQNVTEPIFKNKWDQQMAHTFSLTYISRYQKSDKRLRLSSVQNKLRSTHMYL